MQIISKHKSLIPFHEIIVVEAVEDETVRFGSFLGDKEFFANKGDRVRLRVNVNDCYQVGDRVKLGALITSWNQDNFKCCWVY